MKPPLYVIPHKALPTRLPLMSTALMWLLLDYYGAPGWAWGVIGTLYGLLWVGCLMAIWRQEFKPLPGYGDEK